MSIDVAGSCVTSRPALGSAAALFRSLGDPARLAIARRLAQGEARVTDLVAQLGLAQSTVSAHVACLRGCGLVEGRPVGRQVFYRLVRPELLELFAAAEQLLAATGEAVSLCPNYGDPTRPIAQASAVVVGGTR
ncbi:ArsR/SmtB family transcription factor [Segeticoccus rhizosphaerae]|uniref:ArsR/SmtB family transcription factor n=1 Tax=Segeticoccus rhizosphaerae TaxID=1104777 RepID=UPI0010C077EF|nr:metalloregulator ArsR/SmtB family transcription factor [Ornithinicoccus soli]